MSGDPPTHGPSTMEGGLVFTLFIHKDQ